MKKILKRGLIAMAMTFSLTCTGFALASVNNSGNDLKIDDEYVKGNCYTSIVKGNKTQSNKTLSVLVTNMLEDDGTSSDYRYSWWQVVNTTDGVTINSGTKVLKGTSCQIPLSRRTGTNKKLSVSVKGNTNNLDTILSATIFGFNK